MIALKLLSLLGWLKRGLQALVGLAGRYPWQAALIASLCLSGWLWHGKGKALEQRDAARVTIAQMETASKTARAAQIALNNANQELSQRIAEDATLRHAEIVSAANRAVADYSSRNRVQNYCRGSGPRVAPLPVGPGTPVDPGPDPDLVAVPRNEFEALAKAAVQGRESTSFLIELVNNGLAVPLEYPEPGF